MGTDFFDEDLLRFDSSPGKGKSVPRHNKETDDGTSEPEGHDDHAGRMARQKEDILNQVVGAVGEIERLRVRQEELAKKKDALEGLTRKQDEYESGKREIIEKLDRSMVVIEKEETQATRMAELLAETRVKFAEMRSELGNINEEKWGDENFHAELNKAAATVKVMESAYAKAIARVDAAGWHKSVPDKVQRKLLQDAAGDSDFDRNFYFWIKIGYALSLPMIICATLLFVLWLISTGIWP